MDIIDIVIKTSRQNIVEHGRIWQIAVDYYKLRQSCDQSLIAELVKTGKYM